MKNKNINNYVYDNNRGFTAIEFAVSLLIVATVIISLIPTIMRIIDNSKKETFKNTSIKYCDTIREAVLSGGMNCYSKSNMSIEKDLLTLENGLYAYYFDSNNESGKLIMKKGGKTWGGEGVSGYVVIEKGSYKSNVNYKYYIQMSDGSYGYNVAEAAKTIKKKSFDVGKTSKLDGFGTRKFINANELGFKSGIIYKCDYVI